MAAWHRSQFVGRDKFRSRNWKAHWRRLPKHPETLFCFTENRRLGEGEENHLLAGCCADVMVQGHHLDAGDLLNHRLQDRTGCFNQMGSHLLEQVPSLFGGQRLDQVLWLRSNRLGDAQRGYPPADGRGCLSVLGPCNLARSG